MAMTVSVCLVTYGVLCGTHGVYTVYMACRHGVCALLELQGFPVSHHTPLIQSFHSSLAADH